MKRTGLSKNDVAISRSVLMLLTVAVLSALTYAYILPFQKHHLNINRFYLYIEYGVMAFTWMLLIVCIGASRRGKHKDQTKSVVTPNMCLIICAMAAVASVIIPLSANRVLMSKYAMIAYACVWLAYIAYYFVRPAFAFQVIVCTVYCFLLRFADIYFNNNVTFHDVPAFSYSAYLLAVALIVLLVILCTMIVRKTVTALNLNYTSTLSVITVAAFIVRMFFIRYTASVAIGLLIIVLLFCAVLDKKARRG